MRLTLRVILFGILCALAFAPTRADAAPPMDTPTYIVQSGDTLFSIATRYNTTIAALKKLNGMGASDLIQVGQKLIVPASENQSPATVPAKNTLSYTIQPGDTLQRIAWRYGTTLRELQDLNDLLNPNLLSVGQAIAIPTEATLAKPGVSIDALNPRQGGTIVVRVARPDLSAVTGILNSKPIKFTRAGGYFYTLIGVSRCAKIGALPLAIITTDDKGQALTENTPLHIAATAYPVDAITLPPAGLSILRDSALIKRESDALAAIVNQRTPTRLWSGAFRQPVYNKITEFFGTRRSYNGGPVGACGHEGADFSMKLGEPIYSAARGRVVFAALTQVRGNLVVVDHGLGVFSGYYHMSELSVKVGQMVKPGDLIGKAGSTGLSTGPHLHWSLWVNGEYVDPMEWTQRVIP
jgi:murein DD-endopeptidase MepM/ murein hydrolase activator NlpD